MEGVLSRGYIYIYIDICSGSSAENRPELQHVLSQARQKLINIVLVRTVSRLGRNTLDQINHGYLGK